MLSSAVIFIAKVYYFIYITWIVYGITHACVDGYFDPSEEEQACIAVLSLALSVLLLLLLYYGWNKFKGNMKGLWSFLVLGLITVSFLVVVGCLCFRNYYSSGTGIQGNIQRNISKRNREPIESVYGKFSMAISHELGVVHPLLSRDRIIHFATIMTNAYLNNDGLDQVNEILTSIFGTRITGSEYFQYNLFWYLCVSNNSLGGRLTKSQKSYIANLSEDELLSLLPENYIGSRDRASVLFYLVSGKYVPTYRMNDRHDQVKNYPPNVVYNLAFGNYNIIDNDLRTVSMYPPHVYVAQHEATPWEAMMVEIDNYDLDELLDQMGMLVEGSNDNVTMLPHKEKVKYVLGDLSLYGDVMTRESGLERPIPLDASMLKEEIYQIISKYTNKELVDAYEPRSKWKNRMELLDRIHNDVTGFSTWSLVHRFCTNDDTINLLSGDSHGETNKDDIDDPTFSFGIHRNYRCYQASELEASFREYDGVFMFQRPDWVHGEEGKEFTVTQVQELQQLLEEAPLTDTTLELNNKITEGLRMLTSAELRTIAIKDRYDTFTEEQKSIVKIYLGWLFSYAMWMRFWKGPGYNWPVKTNKISRLRNKRSSPEERNEHVIIQNLVRSRIVEAYESDETLMNWIDSLPNIHYDFRSGESSCAQYPIKQVMDEIRDGSYCMGFGSDHILKTAYYFILKLFVIEQGSKFDNFIGEIMPELVEIESEIVASELGAVDNSVSRNSTKYKVLRKRQRELQKEIPTQAQFDYWNYQNNTHTE